MIFIIRAYQLCMKSTMPGNSGSEVNSWISTLLVVLRFFIPLLPTILRGHYFEFKP